MLNLQSLISPSTNVNVGDMLQIKSALQALGFELDKASKNSPLPDQSSFTALKNFQRSENLKIDGIAKPNGPTVLALNNKISKSDSAIEAFKDFKHNYQKMRDANTMNADKYFHCKANFEAASRGPIGVATSKILSNVREGYGFLKGDSLQDIRDDQRANRYGRKMGESKEFNSSQSGCEIFRPRGLNQKY